MENAQFTGQLIFALTGIAVLAGVLIQTGRVLQKVETLAKEIESVKEDINDIHKDMEIRDGKNDVWRTQLAESLAKMSEKTAVIEQKLIALK